MAVFGGLELGRPFVQDGPILYKPSILYRLSPEISVLIVYAGIVFFGGSMSGVGVGVGMLRNTLKFRPKADAKFATLS